MLSKYKKINLYPYYIRQLIWRNFYPFIIKLKGIEVGKGVRFYGMPIIALEANSSISIGSNSTICSLSQMTALGVNHPAVLRTLKPGARILIGNNTGISGGVICAALNVEIGNRCLIGANVTIADTDFHTVSPVNRYDDRNIDKVLSGPVIIGNDVFIGAGAMILKGVTIGSNSIIGAGSIVTKNVPPDSIAAGNPARVIKSVFNT